MAKLYGISLFTIALLMAMVGGLLGVGLQGEFGLSLEAVLALTAGFTALMWLLSPWFIDLTQRIFYTTRFLSFEEFAVLDQDQAAFIRTVCERHGLRLPSIRLIEDQNPTAFCYGSASWNARIAVSSGLFHYLHPEEVKAVIAHELGHIRNMDFLVMSMGSCLVMMLYELYHLMSTRNKKQAHWAGSVAYVMYWVGTYLLLYLSRTREYLADQFSARETGDPNLLASALVKIAYGIAAEPDTAASRRLLAATRALGVYDFKHADAVGMSYKGSGTAEASATGTKRVEHVMLFDVFNPWATVVELGSTHPLTGKRIRALSVLAADMGKRPLYDFELVRLEGGELDRTRLYRNFAFDIAIYFAPLLGGFAGVVLARESQYFGLAALGGAMAGWGAGMIVQAMVRYPTFDEPRQTTVFELMCDPYASPLRGQFVTVNGTVVGRSVAGHQLNEDLVLQDTGGSIVHLNFRSWLPLFGDLFFGVKHVKTLIRQPVVATGWFHRSIMGSVDLKSVSGLDRQFRSYPRMWQLLFGGLLTACGTLLWIGVSSHL